MKKTFTQILENLPTDILNLPRFVHTRKTKPKAPYEGWSKPENQKFYHELEKPVGFVAATENDDSFVFYDFDHVLDDNGNFVNANAEKWFNYLHDDDYFCERTISGKGLHMFGIPTKGKFPKGYHELDLGDGAKIEIFYGTNKNCCVTGDCFHCEPKAPVAHGQAADEMFQAVLNEVAKQSKNAVETKQEAPAELIYQSAGNTSNNLGIEYDLFRAELMLKALSTADHKDLSYNKWLAVITACKNIGVPYAVVDSFCQCDPTNYNAEENQKRWEGLNNPSMDIETIHGIAKKFGYKERDARREWYKLHPELTTEIIHRPEPMRDNDQQEKFSWTQDKIKSCPVNLRLSNDYTFSTNGISLVVETKKGVKYVPVTKTPIVPTKIFREPTKSKFSYEIAILIRGVWRTTEVDGRALADPRAIIGLADTGALIDEPKILCRFLNATIALNPDLKETKAYSQTGWTDDTFTTFAYPGNGDCIIRRTGFDFDKTLATRGDAELWKKKFIEVLEKGGAIAHAYFGTALAAIVARPLNIMNPQAHLLGTSGGGKTALQKFTASTFGNPRKLMRNFAATNKNRQLVAAAFCDLPSFYDELETIQGKAAEENLSNDVYNFADGKGNQANKRDGTARETFEFGGARLTTGERPILKQRDQRGAYKRLMQYHIHGKLFDDEFAADLHIFSESNFGHFALQWIQFATEHMQEIRAAYQHWAKSNPTTRNYEPTHLKTLAASLVAVEFFKVMLGVNSEYDAVSLVRNRRIILDTQLPTIDQMDDTTRAIDFLKSFVAGNDRAFAHEVDKPDFDNEFTQQTPECIGKIFKNSEVAFLPHAFTEILEKRGGFASADKLREEFCAKGYLRHSEGKTTYPTYFRDKKVRMIRFLPNIITTEELTKLENNASAN